MPLTTALGGTLNLLAGCSTVQIACSKQHLHLEHDLRKTIWAYHGKLFFLAAMFDTVLSRDDSANGSSLLLRKLSMGALCFTTFEARH